MWPHDNALIAQGFARYRLTEAVHRTVRGAFEASAFMELHRLPELFCGFPRRSGEGPTQYPVACSPQAWAAGSVFLFLRALLGRTVIAPKRKVEFRPALLPDYLQWVEIGGLRVGDASVDLHLDRRENNLGIAVGSRHGDVKIVAIN